MMLDFWKIIKRPLLTEKSTLQKEVLHQYTFEVAREATKHQIKAAVEGAFKVHVESVRTAITRGKFARVGKNIGQKSNWKKAFIALKKGEKIDLLENV